MRRVFTMLIAGMLASIACGCGPSPAYVVGAEKPGDATVFVIARGWHTDIGLPVEQIPLPLAVVAQDFPGARFLVFGFGERAYYMSHEETLGQTLSALFPSLSVVLITGLRAPPSDAFGAGNTVALRPPQGDAGRAASFIWHTLEKQHDGALRRLADGPYPGSIFYASSKTYDAFYNCNTWTARALRSAGLPINPRGVLFVGQVMGQARRISALQGAR
jgi:uncharacterized protein (TIGR02117 family)